MSLSLTTSPSDVASRKPVGKPTLTDKQREKMHDKMHDMGGIIADDAQGAVLAQTIIGITRSVSADMARCVLKAFGLSVGAREACMKDLRKWVTQCKINAVENGNITKAGYDLRAARKLANSANTQVSKFNQCIKAMNAGWSLASVAQRMGVDDPEHVGWELMVSEARIFLASNAKGGRPADPFQVKLRKWLDNTQEGLDGVEAKLWMELREVSDKFAKDHPLPVKKEAK